MLKSLRILSFSLNYIVLNFKTWKHDLKSHERCRLAVDRHKGKNST